LLSVGPLRGTRCRLVAGRDSLRAESLGVVVRPLALTPNDVVEIAELLEPVADLMEEDSFEELDLTDYTTPIALVDSDAVEEAPWTPATAEHDLDLSDDGVVDEMIANQVCDDDAAPAVEPIPSAELEVRVLGPIEIGGAEKALTRAKS